MTRTSQVENTMATMNNPMMNMMSPEMKKKKMMIIQKIEAVLDDA